ncbi:MAG TPA: cohesin domain-containing protein, partial [Pyrinomonadaceae bacterium]|nr:cohesin domain-containing protein [Pyrinomonadaceae bacterium]
GEKQQLTVQFKSDAPLGMAVLTMRFDPSVIKIKSVAAGSIFLNTKVAPTITQSIDEHGLMLVSLTPAAGSAVNGEGALLSFEVEAIGAGDSALVFDLTNVHLVASDGRYVTLQIEPIKLTVKQ